MQISDDILIAHVSADETILSVSQLNLQVRQLLEHQVGQVRVEGEISNFVQPGSGHMYFSLKDPTAQVRCAMFRGNNRRLSFTPENGLHVIVTGRASIYAERGDYQLIIEAMEEAGDGALQREFERLKKRLAQEGLFDKQYKKALPSMPDCIGVVTSPTGAAIRDIVSVLRRRFPCARVIIYPSQVQGENAPLQLASAIEIANQRAECDVLIIARGGGSIEDLWAFNDEQVARAIFASQIPTVSGVGHEIDFTIADFVADVRAPTPSAAAELVTPNGMEWLQSIRHYAQHLIASMRELLHAKHLQFLKLEQKLQHPGKHIQEQMQRTDYLQQQLINAMRYLIYQKQQYLLHIEKRIVNPAQRIQQQQQQLIHLQQHIHVCMRHILQNAKQKLANSIHQLDMLSPLATLHRGYAIVSDSTGHVITQATDVQQGEQINIQFAEGQLMCEVIGGQD
ncbi:MAG: exodeoxyribonuclease VII large subunit [Gammaproteobacteria bacterium]